MKNNLNMFLFYMILGIILMTTCVIAYTTDKLHIYYSFDETNISVFSDSVNDYDLYNYNITTFDSVSGIRGNAISQDTFDLHNYTAITNDLSKYSNIGWSINMWVYVVLYPLDRQTLIFFTNSTDKSNGLNLHFSDNSTGNPQYFFNVNQEPLFPSFYVNPYGFFNGSSFLPSQWYMITITYLGQGFNTMNYYVNGRIQKSQNMSSVIHNGSFYPNSNKIVLGNFKYTTLDEMSFWNTTLGQNDLILLYNNGTGLSYSGTLTLGNITITDGCVDENTYCTNRGYNYLYNYYYCNSQAESQFCSGGCTNDICDTSGISECAILGESRCADSTNKEICDDSNGDGYLDFDTKVTCPVGTYCVDFFHLADCKNVSQSGIHTIYGLQVIPYAVNGDNTTYVVNEELKTVNVKSIYSLIQQKFYTTGTYYISRTCDYKETQLFSSGYRLINNYTQITFNSASNLPTIIRLSINPLNDENGSIEFRSQSDTSLGTIRYSRNVSEKRLCLYDYVYNEIYCDYDYTGSDTLNALQLDYTFDFTRKLVSIRILFNRTYAQQKALYPISFSANDVYRLYINGSNTIINSMNVYTIPQLNQFTSLTNNSLTVLPCVYDSVGTRLVRTYGNNDGSPDYSSYTDYNVNVIGLGLSSSQLDQTDTDDELSLKEKHFIYAILITLILSIVVTAMIGFISRGSEKVGGIALLSFLFVFLGGLVFFSLPMIAWMNTLFALLVGLLDAVFIALTVKLVFFST